jgi:hypothetical protein
MEYLFEIYVFVKYNWVQLLQFFWLSYGLLQLPSFYDSAKEQLSNPFVISRLNGKIWLIKLVIFIISIIVVFVAAPIHFIGFLLSPIKKG